MATKRTDIFKVSQFEAKTLSWWNARRSKIDMSPSYQRRGRLWSSTDKAYLIDSILNGFDVPKLYVADFSWGNTALNKKRLPYSIIDGKQRLEAIFDFYDGKLTLNEDFIYRADASLKLAGLGYKDLAENHRDVADIFDTFNLSVMSVVASSEEPINELFVRLNRNKPLTGAEIRNAMGGPAPEVFRKISKHEFFDDYISFAISRGQDLNTAAKLVMLEFGEAVTSTKKADMDEFVKAAAKQREKLELSARRVMDTLETMTEIFLPRDRLLSSAGTVPVYYWFIRSLSAKQLSKVRPFLNAFEERRKEHRAVAAKGGLSAKLDADMTVFDNLNRSTNDGSSHLGRFEILSRQFAAFKG